MWAQYMYLFNVIRTLQLLFLITTLKLIALTVVVVTLVAVTVGRPQTLFAK